MRRVVILAVLALLTQSCTQAASPDAQKRYDPLNVEKWSIAGASIGHRLGDIKATFPDVWKAGDNEKFGYHLYQIPDAAAGDPGIVLVGGHGKGEDSLVAGIVVFYFNPTYADRTSITKTLDLIWGTAIRIRGLEHDRFWIDRPRNRQARLRYVEGGKEDFPQLVLTISPIEPTK